MGENEGKSLRKSRDWGLESIISGKALYRGFTVITSHIISLS